MVKSLPAHVGDIRDLGLIPGSGRSLEKDSEAPWTEETGGLQSLGSQRVGYN